MHPTRCQAIAGLMAAAISLSALPDLAAQDVARGRVLLPDGSPCAGAIVERQREDSIEPAGATAKDGSFAVRLPADRLPTRVVIKAPGYEPSRFAITALPSGFLMESIPTLVLERSTKFSGRVRDAEGKPVAGAMVTAETARRPPTWGWSMPTWEPAATARSDERGIFTLEAVPIDLSLRVQADGCFDTTLGPVLRGAPLEATMMRSGLLRGRVVDAQGKGIAARLTAEYESASALQSATTAADGTFSLSWRHGSHCRIHAETGTPPSAFARTAILTDPGAEVRLELKPLEALACLRIRATGDGGKPLTEFRAVAHWSDSDVPDEWLWTLLSLMPVTVRDGVGYAPPPIDATNPGAVLVVAPGRAPAVAKVVWEPGKDTGAVEVTVATEPARSLRGSVRSHDDKPIAGAKVWAQARQAGAHAAEQWVPPTRCVTTAADGTFVLDHLTAGRFDVQASHPDWIDAKPRRISIPATGEIGQQNLQLSPRVTARGRVRGADRGWEVGFRPNDFMQLLSWYTGVWEAFGPGTPIAADGSFAVHRLAPGMFAPFFVAPRPRSAGSALRMSLEVERLGNEGERELDLDCTKVRPGILRCAITCTQAAPPLERLVVTARPITDEDSPFAWQQSETRAPVALNGSAELSLVPGSYHVQVLDCTGVQLAAAEEPTVVVTAATASLQLAIDVVEVHVELQDADADEKGPAFGLSYRQGTGVREIDLSEPQPLVDILDARRPIVMFVPPGDGQLRLQLGSLPEASTWVGPGQGNPFAEFGQYQYQDDLGAELTAETGRITNVTVKVPRRRFGK